MICKSPVQFSTNKPVAYLEQRANFYGFEFFVDQSTLIPRPETEQLVEKTIELATQYLSTSPSIIDIGTGSGAIAITLKKLLPRAQLRAIDNSAAALRIAKRNAEELHADVIFQQGDLLAGSEQQFDLIIANLPYVPAARWNHLPTMVRDFEPRSAIVGGRDGMKLLRRLADQLRGNLAKKGVVALEIDDLRSERVKALLELALPTSHKVTIEKDLAGFDRFAFAVPSI